MKILVFVQWYKSVSVAQSALHSHKISSTHLSVFGNVKKAKKSGRFPQLGSDITRLDDGISPLYAFAYFLLNNSSPIYGTTLSRLGRGIFCGGRRSRFCLSYNIVAGD